jgi:hypothetical protein
VAVKKSQKELLSTCIQLILGAGALGNAHIYGNGKIEEKCMQSKFTNFTHVISNLFGFGKLMNFSQLQLSQSF